MATFDQLSAEQRAIIELVLQRGKAYDELSDLLGMPESRVRELAREALVSLAPISAEGVDDEWRDQIADYVLGQQSGPDSTATRGHLRRSEAARSWARSLLDSLETLYSEDLPSVPEAERAARSAARVRRPRQRDRGRAEPEAEERPSRDELSDEARAALKRRRLVAAGGLAAVVALIVLVWPVGLLTGGDDEDGGGDGEQASGQQQQAGNRGPGGIAIIAERGGKRQVIVQAAGLPPNKRREAYEVWLYNNPQDSRSLGAQVTDQRGTYQGAGPLPEDFAKYQFIDVSREPIDQNRAHAGQSVLRGRIGKLRQPGQVRRGQAAVLGQVVLAPPRD
jgi:Anti-sigma-K factor rskA/Sigma-70, region 4